MGGFVLDGDDTESDSEIAVMQRLAGEFPDVAFGIIPPERVTDNHLQFLEGQKFVMFSISGDRYIALNKLSDYEALSSFVSSVITNRTLPNRISQQNLSPDALSFETIKHIDRKVDNMIVFVGQDEESFRLGLLCKKVKSALKSDNLQVFMYNASLNDLPDDLPIDSVPVVLMLNKNGVGEFADDHPTVRKVLKFVLMNAANQYDIPALDYKKLDAEVRAELSKR